MGGCFVDGPSSLSGIPAAISITFVAWNPNSLVTQGLEGIRHMWRSISMAARPTVLAVFCASASTPKARPVSRAFDWSLMRLSRLLWRGLRVGERGQHRVQAAYQFHGRRWRERQTVGNMDDKLLPRFRSFICFFGNEANRAERQTKRAAVEKRANKFVGVRLDNVHVVVNPQFGFLLFQPGCVGLLTFNLSDSLRRQ